MGNALPKINFEKQKVFSINKTKKQITYNDMEEVEEDIYIGIGIKRMKGYKCNLTIDELNKKREYFWKDKTNKNGPNWITWKIIHRAIKFDEFKASLLLNEYNIKPLKGCINHLIDKNGNEYKIPNYCINDPYFEKKLENNDVLEESITIRLYGGQQDFKLDLSNKLTGKELKDEIIKYLNLEENKTIRLFENGSEIKDNHFLSQHKLNNEKSVFFIIN